LNHPKSHHYDPKQQEFKIQTNKVPCLVPILTTLFTSNHILSFTPLTLAYLVLAKFCQKPKSEIKNAKLNNLQNFQSLEVRIKVLKLA
jgi:short subunit fatty acids transporter